MKVKLYIQAEKWSSDVAFKIKASTYKRQTDQWNVIVDLSEVEVEIEVPVFTEKQLILAEVEQIKVQMEKEKADFFIRVTAIEEKIQSLLCIEHKEPGNE